MVKLPDLKKPFDVNQMLRDLDAPQEAQSSGTNSPAGEGLDYLRQKERIDRAGDRTDHASGQGSSLPNSPPSGAGTIAEDAINPAHYRRHPSGIECIEVTRHMNFNLGNAIKYIWRHADKGDPVENLKKAQWYLDDEIRRLEGLR